MVRRSTAIVGFIGLASLISLTLACTDDDAGELSGVAAVCALNEEFAELNERTIPDIDPEVPYPDAEALEENFVEGVRLMREMAEEVPAEIREDFEGYTDSIARLAEMYAEFGYDQAEVWENADYEEYEVYAVSEQVRARIGDWFVDNCGMNLQG